MERKTWRGVFSIFGEVVEGSSLEKWHLRIDLQRSEGGSQATVRVKGVSGEFKESRNSLFTYDFQSKSPVWLEGSNQEGCYNR